MNAYLKIVQEKYLEFIYDSKYAAGSHPVHTPQDLVKVIENVCGKGSYCLYKRDSNPDYPEAVDYTTSKSLEGKFPTITYWQQGIKTQVIEQCRDVAIQIWGDIPEMSIGWLENQCKSYIEDIK